jgi:D-3-phosphoglycerate dehydrogenase
MKRILINDGIHPTGLKMLQDAGFECVTDKIETEDLVGSLNAFDAILVRSATKVREEAIKASPNLKLIGRGGVGLDNIDVDYAKAQNIAVVNTPAASSRSVAELAMGHLFSIVRFLPKMNKAMDKDGVSDFKSLKKEASKGTELYGKTLGLIGFGRIGRETASIALGCGMKVLAYDPYIQDATVSVKLHPDYEGSVDVTIKTISKEELLKQSDFVSLHIPGGQGYVLDENEFNLMKEGAGLVNCARGGTVSEKALLKAIEDGKVKYVATDVFETEPPEDDTVLRLPQVGLSPHIGASTVEAQERVGIELAEQVISFFSNN